MKEAASGASQCCLALSNAPVDFLMGQLVHAIDRTISSALSKRKAGSLVRKELRPAEEGSE